MDSINKFLKETFIFNHNIFSEIIYTDKNPAVIESLDIKKIDSNVIRIKNQQHYNLNRFTCNHNEIDSKIKHEMISVIKSSTQTCIIDFYAKGFFKLFKKNKIENILLKIKETNWICCNSNLKNIFSKIENLVIFEDNSLEHEIFIGGFDSLGVIVNNNYKIESDNIEFELLIYNKNVRRLLLQ
jgi:hypothetical protein